MPFVMLAVIAAAGALALRARLRATGSSPASASCARTGARGGLGAVRPDPPPGGAVDRPLHRLGHGRQARWRRSPATTCSSGATSDPTPIDLRRVRRGVRAGHRRTAPGPAQDELHLVRDRERLHADRHRPHRRVPRLRHRRVLRRVPLLPRRRGGGSVAQSQEVLRAHVLRAEPGVLAVVGGQGSDDAARRSGLWRSARHVLNGGGRRGCASRCPGGWLLWIVRPHLLAFATVLRPAAALSRAARRAAR